MFLGQREMGMWLELGEVGWGRCGKGRDEGGGVSRADTTGPQGPGGWLGFEPPYSGK